MPRPKNPDALTSTERTARHRALRPKRREVILSPEIDAKASRLMSERGLTFAALVGALVSAA